MNTALVLALIALMPLTALAETLKESKEWRRCSGDDQCVLIDGKCNKTAVNTRYKEIASLYYKGSMEGEKCVKQFWVPEVVVPQCRLESCSIAAGEKK